MSRQSAIQTQQKTQESSPPPSGVLQRKCACGQHTMAGGECAECRRKRQAGLSAAVQRKLTIGAPDDKYEREADRVADAVMRVPLGNPLNSGHIGSIQRTVTSGDTHASGETAQQIEALQGGGQPLSPSVRSFFEPRFGHDFGDVRVHTDAQAAKSARVINALAYTLGRDVVFGTGQYAPETDAGKRLLAHELTHVVQQSTTANNQPPWGIIRRLLVQRQRDAGSGNDTGTAKTPSNRDTTTKNEQRNDSEVGDKTDKDESGGSGCTHTCKSCECYSIHKCSDQGWSKSIKLMEYYKDAATWIGDALTDIQSYKDYIKKQKKKTKLWSQFPPSDDSYIEKMPAGAKRIALLLQAHFKWDESIRNSLIYPDAPDILEESLQAIFDGIEKCPFSPRCDPSPPQEDDVGKVGAYTILGWQNSNCFAIVPHFKNLTKKMKIHAITHELAHNWAGANDVAYEHDKSYPPRVGSAVNNADSIAAFARET